MDKSSVIFGNPMDPKVVQKAEKAKAGFLKKFGDDTNKVYHLGLKSIDQIPELGIENLVHSDQPLELPENALIVGNIRMGFGHYRIAMAIASCAKALGRQPIWFDLATSSTGSPSTARASARSPTTRGIRRTRSCWCPCSGTSPRTCPTWAPTCGPARARSTRASPTW